jgi:hypothetical protein
MTTCQSDNIVWDYAGPIPAQLTLVLTDANVNQSTTNPPPPAITMTLSANIDATVGNWTWPQVNVSSGYYILQGVIPGVTAETDKFFVANGSDTSCIQPQSLTPSQTPIGTSSKKINVGAIVGGTVGGVVVITVALVALLLFRSNSRSRSRQPAAAGRWGGLGSIDDNDPFSAGKIAALERGGHGHGQTESTVGIRGGIDPAAVTPVTANSQDDIYSVDDEKLTSTPPKHRESHPSPYTTNHRRTSTVSSFRNQTCHAAISSAQEGDSIALPVIDTQTEARRRRSADVGRSISAPGRRSQPPMNKPEFPSPEMIRTASGSSVARRASRKPVPHYDEADLETHLAKSNKVEASPFEPESDTDTPSPSTTASTLRNSDRKSSLGDARQMHYLIPDLPLAGNV